MTRTLTIIFFLLSASLGPAPIVSAGPADCSPLAPAAPGPGAVNQAEWYAKANAYNTCNFGNGVSDPVRDHGGNVAFSVVGYSLWPAFYALFLISEGAVLDFEAAVAGAALSESHDACGALLGDTNPNCGGDPPVAQAQYCPAVVPNPIGGGLGGNTLVNSNAVVQATCALALGDNPIIAMPSPDYVIRATLGVDYEVFRAKDETTDMSNESLAAACIYVTGASPCL